MFVLKYLEMHSIEDLESEFGIKVKHYPADNIAIFNYDQLNSPKFHLVVRECRGLILDLNNNKVISRSFPRFYNLNEWSEDPFDFNSSYYVEEKADGSMMVVYFNKTSWYVSTRKQAFSEGNTSFCNLTFKELFESIVGSDVNSFMLGRDTDYSYVFEVCSWCNKVIKTYKEPRVYLLAAFHKDTGNELTYDQLNDLASKLHVYRPKLYKFNSVEDMVASFKDMDITEEGYVIVDKNLNRIKVKNPAYVDLHHMKGEGMPTERRIVDIIFRGEDTEVLSYFPEFKEYFDPWQKAYAKLLELIKRDKHLVKNVTDRKRFAEQIKDLPHKHILFNMLNGKSFNNIVNSFTLNGKVRLLTAIRKELQNG